jgi:CRISPR-associated endoribonuclease Cas6
MGQIKRELGITTGLLAEWRTQYQIKDGSENRISVVKGRDMLTSMVITITADEALTLPANLGRAAQALLLSLLAERDPTLAQTLHNGEGPRPYTAANLVLGKSQRGQRAIPAEEEGWLRFTGLTAAVSSALTAIAADPPPQITLDGQALRVTGATLDPAAHPWAGSIAYQEMAAQQLLGSERRPADRVQLQFAAPTTFRSGGRSLPLPLPELVFGSLLDRWQAFAPVGLSPEARRFAQEMVAISRYQLRTESMPAKGNSLVIGFTGRATYKILSRDRYWLSVLNLLSAYAFYSGVGYHTAAGLGQVRQVSA